MKLHAVALPLFILLPWLALAPVTPARVHIVGMSHLEPAGSGQEAQCAIPVSSNPLLTADIDPRSVPSLNPNVVRGINPSVVTAINPRDVRRLNPGITTALNPDHNTRLNPNLGPWQGYYVCTPDGQLVGAATIGSADVMLLFVGDEWIGYFVTNRRGSYNYFNRPGDWAGFLVPLPTGGFNLHDLALGWHFQLQP